VSSQAQASSIEPHLVLASGSPRRRELLQSVGIKFTVTPSSVDETSAEKDPRKLVIDLSLEKARDVAARINANPEERTLVLGSDTIVVLDDQILGKPASSDNAYEMLMQLSGRAHQVYTGVSIVELPGGREESICQCSSVFFRELDPAEALYYANSEEPMDKAGAYALQGTAAAFVEKVDGCYSNIIGLPLPATVKLLRKFGMKVMGVAR
jgi:septum formation protein